MALKDQEGPIKEHLLEEVYQKRQRSREAQQGAETARTEQLEDKEDRFEGHFDASTAGPSWSGRGEDEELEELDGEQLSAFNMDREQEEGFDLETLEMTRGRGEEEELAKDPWLASLQQEHVRVMGHDPFVFKGDRRESAHCIHILHYPMYQPFSESGHDSCG